MKTRMHLLMMIAFLFMISTSAIAQDDVYYTPENDPSNQYTYEYVDTTPEQTSTVDRYDGYSTATTESLNDGSNTYVTNNYYYDDYDNDYYYTTRLRRYYTPNWGIDYYSYWFTPTYYFGWGNWGGGYASRFSPWYYDSWWGWNNCSYYNSWYDPWWGNSYCTTAGWGWNNWNYGGYYCGANGWGGYNNGYYNGYNQGYNNGYYDGWYSGYYNNPGYYYNGPRRHRSTIDGQADINPALGNSERRELTNIRTNSTDFEIPREGVQRPIQTAKPVQDNVQVNVKPGNTETVTPYDDKGKVVIGRQGQTQQSAVTEKQVQPQIRENTTVVTQQRQTPVVTKPGTTDEFKAPVITSPKQRDGYTPQVLDNQQNNTQRREDEERYKPQQPVQPNTQYNQQNNYRQPVQRQQQPRYEQPRQERVVPQQQPRSFEQPRQQLPKMNTTPQQQPVQPRMQQTVPQQRNLQPRSYQ